MLNNGASKICSTCKNEYPHTIEFFYMNPNTGAWYAACRDCHRKRQRAWREKNRDKYLEQNRRAAAKRRANDPEGELAYQRQWRAANPERMLDYAQRISERNRLEGLRAKQRHGITPQQTQLLREFQEGRCAICRRLIARFPEGDEKRQYIDHNHATGFVRGLLCNKCNASLGWYERNAAAISQYITSSPCQQLGLEIITERRRSNPTYDTYSSWEE